MSTDDGEFADPVDLPDGIHHCGPTAYNLYKCRCRYCVTWRRLYDQKVHAQNARARMAKRREARDYLAFRGIQLNGPGPFGRSPRRLALIVADYLGDDLDALLDGRGRLWR